jgi:hypothetical protein
MPPSFGLVRVGLAGKLGKRRSLAGCWGLTLLSLVATSPASGATKHAAAHAKTKAKPLPKCVAAPKEEPIAVAGAKVAMFAFTGDDAEPIRRQVQHVLRAKGIKINANLRAVDSAEQYREMATTLNLIAYIDGEVDVDGTEGSATIFVRSGATGLRIASATFSGERHVLATNLGKDLWTEIGPALGRAFADAAKPRHLEREPMRINAGTPLTDADETN